MIHLDKEVVRGSRAIVWLLTGMLFLALVACRHNPYTWSGTAADRVRKEAGAGADAKTTVPREVSDALLATPEASGAAGVRAPIEHRFDLAVNNAPARQVFMGLAEGTGYSMLIHPDVNGSLTLALRSVTVEEAMSAIRTLYGYEYKRDGARYLVLGRGLQTRIYPVNYLNITRKGKSDTRVTPGELSQKDAGQGSSGGGGDDSKKPDVSASGVRVETVGMADFWKDLGESLKIILGTEGGRQVVVNPQASIVIVRAMPDELRRVEEYLGATQNAANRQVILEAKVLNVQLNDRYQTGINWGAVHGSTTLGQVGGGTVFSNSGLSEIAGNPGVLNPNAFAAISGTNASAFGGVFSAAIRATDFTAFIEALKTQGDVHVMSSPRVSTLNNQKAVIKVGGEEFFITGISSTPITNAAGTIIGYQPEIEVNPFFSGVALDVTPQIGEDGNIVMHIHPSVSEVKEKVKSISVNNVISTMPLAISSIQESDNVVRAESGQVIVIGGLMKEGATDDNASIPLLGDIPLIGNLFKHKRVTRIKNELVILVKPTIVETRPDWNKQLERAQTQLGRVH